MRFFSFHVQVRSFLLGGGGGGGGSHTLQSANCHLTFSHLRFLIKEDLRLTVFLLLLSSFIYLFIYFIFFQKNDHKLLLEILHIYVCTFFLLTFLVF